MLEGSTDLLTRDLDVQGSISNIFKIIKRENTCHYLDVPLEVRINGWDQWVISPTYKWGIPWGYNPLTNHLLTSWDIQVEPQQKTPALLSGILVVR